MKAAVIALANPLERGVVSGLNVEPNRLPSNFEQQTVNRYAYR